jgi:L-alanine-DL-glutamate epimerase-like enolase superfamily enzyme
MVDDAVKNTTAQNAPAVLPTAGTNTDKKPATPAETALDAAKAAQQGAAGTKLPINQPDPVWDRQILSRMRRSKGENVKAL